MLNTFKKINKQTNKKKKITGFYAFKKLELYFQDYFTIKLFYTKQ